MQSADAAQHRAHGARAAEGIPAGVGHAAEALRPRRQLPEALHAVPAAGARGPGAAGVPLLDEHHQGLEVPQPEAFLFICFSPVRWILA